MHASARPLHWKLRGAVTALASFTLAASLMHAIPAYAAAPPTEISLATNLSTVAAGQTYRLTATASSTVTASGSHIEVVQVETESVVASCTTGSACTFSSTFPADSPRSYLARVIQDSTSLVLAESAPVVVAREPWAVELKSSATALQAGQTAKLTATTNQYLDRTDSNYALYIFDRTSGSLLKSCSSGRSCSANVSGQGRDTELHRALDPIAQNSRTTAALNTREGSTVLASGGRDLNPVQRALAQSDEIIARPAPGVHAEVTAVMGARAAGLTPRAIGTSRPIRSACAEFLGNAGAVLTSPPTAI